MRRAVLLSTILASSNLRYQYMQRNLQTFAGRIVQYLPISDATGAAVAADASGLARNGAYSGVTLGQAGIGDGLTSGYWPGSGYLNCYSVPMRDAFNGSEGMLACWINIPAAAKLDNTMRLFGYFERDASNKFVFQKTTANKISIDYVAGGVAKNWLKEENTFVADTWYPFTIAYSLTGDVVNFYWGGQWAFKANGLGTWAGQLAAATCCWGARNTSGQLPWTGGIAHGLITSAFERDAAIAAYARKRALLVYDGDSQTIGSVGPVTPYPTRLATTLADLNTVYRNFALGSQKITDLATDAATQIDPLISPSIPTILTVWAGTNDIMTDAVDAATCHQRLADYCTARRAAGLKVIVCTLVAGNSGLYTNATRNAVNDLIRANYTSYADGLADLAANANIGGDGDENNTTYFNADKLHLTNTGQIEVAGVVETAIRARL
jgi:lysophospholipase L1-like esterase